MLRCWLPSFAEFQLMFDERDVVKEIRTDPMAKNLVVMP